MKLYIRKYRFHIAFGLLVFSGLFLFFLVSLGYYPIAIVNGDVISGRKFKKHFEAGNLYYDRFQETYKELIAKDSTLAPRDIQASILEQLIEDKLVHKGVREELKDDFDYLLKAKVEKYDEDVSLQQAALTLYGLNFNDFKEEILIPQAERELLSARLFLKGEKIEDWLLKTKRTSKVSILSNQFHWTGDKVELK